MYAVVNIGGKQAKVEEGSLVAIEKVDAQVGETVTLPVITIVDGSVIYAAPSECADARVEAEVLEHFKGEKQVVFKFKKRKGYKRTKGHRQSLTEVKILSISRDGAVTRAVEPVTSTAAEVVVAGAPEAVAVEASEAATCAALKSDGTPCTNKPKEGSLYCGVHAKKYEG